MENKIIKNKYLNAFLLLLLYSAVFHFIVLVLRCFLEKTVYPLNFFNILNLNFLFPSIFKDTLSGDVISVIVVIVIYLFLLKKQRLLIEEKK